jgi:hypothetical protein
MLPTMPRAPTKLLICPGEDAGDLAAAVGERLGEGFEVSAAAHAANGGASPAGRIAEALTKIEAAALEDPPDAVLLDGNGEATLAAALVFAKLEVPMIRVRAGGEHSQDAALAERLCDVAVDDDDPEAVASAVRGRLGATG